MHTSSVTPLRGFFARAKPAAQPPLRMTVREEGEILTVLLWQCCSIRVLSSWCEIFSMFRRDLSQPLAWSRAFERVGLRLGGICGGQPPWEAMVKKSTVHGQQSTVRMNKAKRLLFAILRRQLPPHEKIIHLPAASFISASM